MALTRKAIAEALEARLHAGRARAPTWHFNDVLNPGELDKDSVLVFSDGVLVSSELAAASYGIGGDALWMVLHGESLSEVQRVYDAGIDLARAHGSKDIFVSPASPEGYWVAAHSSPEARFEDGALRFPLSSVRDTAQYRGDVPLTQKNIGRLAHKHFGRLARQKVDITYHENVGEPRLDVALAHDSLLAARLVTANLSYFPRNVAITGTIEGVHNPADARSALLELGQQVQQATGKKPYVNVSTYSPSCERNANLVGMLQDV